MKKELYLCFACDDTLYFSSKKAEEMTGDDWNDIPLEHNAESPSFSECEEYAILEFRQPFSDVKVLPFEKYMQLDRIENSRYSAEMLNKEREVPWVKITQKTKAYFDKTLGFWKDFEVIHSFYANETLENVSSKLDELKVFYKIKLTNLNKDIEEEDNFVFKAYSKKQKEILVDLNNGYLLSAQTNIFPFDKEIICCLKDKNTNLVYQDITMISFEDNKIVLRAWADANDEDYTNKYLIDIYEEDSEN